MTRAAAFAQMLLGLFVSAVAVAFLVDAARLPPPSFDVLGSATVPRTLSILVIAMALPLVLQGALHLGRTRHRDEAAASGAETVPPRRPWLAVIAFGLACLYALALQNGWLTYAVATTLFLIGLTTLLSGGKAGQMLAGIVLALILGFGGDYLFTTVFLIDLP